MRKKFLSLFFGFICFFSCACGFSACKKDDRPKIVVTVFPEYDWVINVLGDKKEKYDILLLQDSGTDLHNFQPTITDKGRILDSTVFIYVGGESDAWAEEMLINNKIPSIVNLMSVLGDRAIEEEEIDGEEEHEHEHGEKEYDEHVWLSLKNARLFVGKIAEEFIRIDPENADIYRNNAANYTAELTALDGKYERAAENKQKDAIVVADRFPFLYLTRDYGITYFAAFSGCSAETQVTPSTVARLSEKVEEYGLNAVIKLEGSDGRCAIAVKNSTSNENLKILTLDSMQTTTLKSGKTYLSVMENNLEVIKDALEVSATKEQGE